MKSYKLPILNPPKKDKAFDILSKSNNSLNKKNKKDPFDDLKKATAELGQARKPRAASRNSVKQYKA